MTPQFLEVNLMREDFASSNPWLVYSSKNIVMVLLYAVEHLFVMTLNAIANHKSHLEASHVLCSIWRHNDSRGLVILHSNEDATQQDSSWTSSPANI